MRRTTFVTTVLAVGVVALSGCGSGGDDGSAGAPGGGPAEDAELATADSDLGTIVVDDDGKTVYVFDKDTPGSGKSSCTGECLEAWPPVVAESDSPVADGVTGDVGTITRDDGTAQLTLDGSPLYYWQGDVAPGDVTGQGVQGVWWVVAPDGSKIQEAPAPAAPDGY
jgi:predicted lipoprotein with Yx(FWY)xxD motif